MRDFEKFEEIIINLRLQKTLVVPSILNSYKFVKIEQFHWGVEKEKHDLNEQKAITAIGSKLSSFGLTLLSDNNNINNKCDVLFCYFGAPPFESRGGRWGFGDIYIRDIYFTNCRDSIVLFIPQLSKSYIKWTQQFKEFKKSPDLWINSYVDQIFEAFGSYHYTYSPSIQAASSNTIPAQINPPVQNNTSNTGQPSAVTNDKTKITAPTQNLTSDVDVNIPSSATPNSNRFALIIGNEDYSSKNGNLSPEMNVPFAVKDAEVFKSYCIKTLGIPEDHIRYYENATLGNMKFGINWLKSIAKAGGEGSELFMYYAGHGIPDPINKTSYLMPVDCSPSDLTTGIMLKDVYTALGSSSSKTVTVFLDACFSGGGRAQGLVAARSVRIAPKEESLQGNLVVFSATSGEETSMAYNDKQHGMFTYFLLKELQETKGAVSLKQLADYLKKNVSLQSLVVNNKEQTPQVSVSSSLADSWENRRMK